MEMVIWHSEKVGTMHNEVSESNKGEVTAYGLKESDHPSGTSLLQHQQAPQTEQNQIHVVPCKKQKKYSVDEFRHNFLSRQI